MEKMPTPKILSEGIQLCLNNAESYVSSSEILFGAKKYKEALILNGFAQEELGKILNIFNALHYTKNKKNWDSWKERFKSHQDKLWFGEDVDDIIERKLPKESNKKNGEKKFIERLGIMYIDYDGEKFIMPREISREEVEDGINQTKKRFEFHKKRHPSIIDDEKSILEQYELTKDMSYAELRRLVEDMLSE